VVLLGNPNCGKTTLFKLLTGLREKVGNYAGVTVERKEGDLLDAHPGIRVRVLDLPGTYSLTAQSPDEEIARDVLLQRFPVVPPPSVVVVVVDASNLQRNLYLATQVIELGYPTMVVVNKIDVAEMRGTEPDVTRLEEALGVPVIPAIASIGCGVAEFRHKLSTMLGSLEEVAPQPRRFLKLPPAVEEEVGGLAEVLTVGAQANGQSRLRATALLALTGLRTQGSEAAPLPGHVERAVAEARQRLNRSGIDCAEAAVAARHAAVAEIFSQAQKHPELPFDTRSDKLDRVLTHKVWGALIFVGIMALLFQSIFTFAKLPMEGIQAAVDWLGGAVGGLIPPGDLNSLLTEGVIAGVGAVVIFLPQIVLLFLFIGFLEDTGYMARAALLMDRLMSKVGLHGKSFIPMLSSFACAIPGIMATRTIENRKDRLVTILIAPLMSCSARLPVYTLLIAACIPDIRVFGFLKLTGVTMLSMFLLGVITALGMAWIFKRTLLRGDTPMLILELPPYKRPELRMVLRQMWDRSLMFLKQAGTIILALNILLWFLATYPRNPEFQRQYDTRRAAVTADTSLDESAKQARLTSLTHELAGDKLRHSFAGRMGRAIEPVIAPLGFDWKIGIGIISSFAAREVFVSTMSTVYNVGSADGSGSTDLVKTLKEQRRANGEPMYTPLTGVTLMVFYVFALQCVSTIAVVRRETGSWKWTAFQWAYMAALAWTAAFLVRMVGTWAA
jgi:ferrous iron transport protein B